MNKTQLIDVLADRFQGNRRQAAHALESVLDTITREVSRGERVAISGFGSFEKKVKQARTVRNPKTGERLHADETAVAKFTPGAALKEVVAGVRMLPALVIEPVVAAAGIATRTSAPAQSPAQTPAQTPAPTPAKKATARKSSAQRSGAKKSTAKKSTAKKSAAKKSTAKKSTARSTAKTTTARETAEKS